MPGAASVVELEDAVVLLAEPELARRAEHALGRLAADLARFSILRPPGSVAPTRAKGYFSPR